MSASDPSTMKGLVEVLARALVDDPAPVEVFASGTGEEQVYRLKVARDDLGKVIGKKGRTAKAFRTLLAAAGAKQNARVTLEILEPESGAASSGTPGAAVADKPDGAGEPRAAEEASSDTDA